MNKDAAITIAKKLKALAEKSVDGERVAATKKLAEFCFKHGLDEDEYTLEIVKASVSFNGYIERILLSSVMCMVMETDAVRGRVENDKFVFQCTPRQLEDIVDAFEHYKSVHADYSEGAMLAIITRNEIKNKKPPKTEFRMEDMTEDERREYQELMAKANPPPTDQSGKETGGDSTENQPIPPTDKSGEQIKTDKKNNRIQRMFMVVEQTQWVKKVRAKLFLD